MIKCLRCGRPLKSETSRKRGYGKGCFNKMKESKIFQQSLDCFESNKEDDINDRTKT